MAIRDRFRRAIRKSDSDTSVAHIENNSSSGSNSQASSVHRQPTSSLPKFTFSWGRSSDKEKEQRKEEKEKRKQGSKKSTSNKPIHPRDKPLTAANLRHQEMLGGFDFSFGSSPNRLSQLVPAEPFDIGVSPCCTRAPSINGDAVAADQDSSDSDQDGPLGASHDSPLMVAVTGS